MAEPQRNQAMLTAQISNVVVDVADSEAGAGVTDVDVAAAAVAYAADLVSLDSAPFKR
ncbi:hypothetical protein COEREDRAFT_10865 [Coemansia reversa NRRL 1564]|uniref:Uncharacterized protein n=1 Tax=Coemansia reversa (strain ATCC 12441 / NRRL 1564) TaxID=763665 RepID=A0A2G5B4J5_COERN|nr:hypothetical protein COEREDRAFT_10865 [Coemansia reversa NRRL 1564]|eukprot:PIA13925.1 hypothetical protein COEREDRAFT_10865 [Coemansia reversa NRRL 1564]